MKEENVSAGPAAQEGTEPMGNEPKGSAPNGSLGKFKSVDALMKAYEELEAEFTRRSQRLKALEKSKAEPAEVQVQEKQSGTEEGPSSSEGNAESGSEALFRAVTESGEVRERVIAEYLRSLGSVPLMTKGSGVTAPPQKPKTFAEAGSLALGYLKNKK